VSSTDSETVLPVLEHAQCPGQDPGDVGAGSRMSVSGYHN
jgi:hypothetical protein